MKLLSILNNKINKLTITSSTFDSLYNTTKVAVVKVERKSSRNKIDKTEKTDKTDKMDIDTRSNVNNSVKQILSKILDIQNEVKVDKV